MGRLCLSKLPKLPFVSGAMARLLSMDIAFRCKWISGSYSGCQTSCGICDLSISEIPQWNDRDWHGALTLNAGSAAEGAVTEVMQVSVPLGYCRPRLQTTG